MRLLIGIIVFFTRQTVYWVTCIGKLTKLSNILCKNTKMGDAEKFFFFFFFLNVLLRIALKTRSVNKR